MAFVENLQAEEEEAEAVAEEEEAEEAAATGLVVELKQAIIEGRRPGSRSAGAAFPITAHGT